MSSKNELEMYLRNSKTDVSSMEQLKNLSHELDCLGLPTINVNVDILQQLISSIYKLMSLYKKNITQQNDLQLKTTVMESEMLSQKKAIDNYQDNLEDKEDEIQKLKNTVQKQTMDITELQEDKKRIGKELDALKCLYNREGNQQTHTLMKLKLTNDKLRERLGEEVGKYKSRDMQVAETVNKYKIKMDIYEETIQKLQYNNEQLLNEILNLKEEVLMTLHNVKSVY